MDTLVDQDGLHRTSWVTVKYVWISYLITLGGLITCNNKYTNATIKTVALTLILISQRVQVSTGQILRHVSSDISQYEPTSILGRENN